jgi:hypothetical protein
MLSTKHLLSGSAMIASVVIGSPVWAATALPIGAVAARVMPMTTIVADKQLHCAVQHPAHRRVHTANRARRGDIANRLNRAELDRLTMSITPPAGAQVYNGGPIMIGSDGSGYGQPSPTQGIPGAWQASASSRAPADPSWGRLMPGGSQASASSHAPADPSWGR